MKALAALFLSAAAFAQAIAPQHQALLHAHKYVIQDGKVIDALGAEVPANELPFVLHRLESAQRLRALLQINIVLNASAGEKHLTAEERDKIRKIAKENWPYFPLATRKDFRRYFTVEELAGMDTAPAPVAGAAAFELKDQEPAIVEEPTTAPPERPAVAASPAPRLVTAQPAAALTPAMPALMTPLAIAAMTPPASALPPVAPPPAPAAAAPAAVTPAAVAPAPVVPAAVSPAPAPAAVAATPPVIDLSPVPIPAQTPAPPVILVAVDTKPAEGFTFGEAPKAVAVDTAAAQLAAPQAPPQHAPERPAAEVVETPKAAPKLDPVTPEALEKFLEGAPYGREAKVLLRLIAQRAPAGARDRALNTLMFALPAVNIGPAKAGERWDSELRQGQPREIGLRPGVTTLKRRKLLFGSREFVVADAPGGEKQPFSPEQQAGALLAELLRLDAELRGEAASPAAVELWARGAQNLFYAAVNNALGHDKFLDPATRISFRRWLDHAEEERDHLFFAFTSARSSALDPKQSSPAAQREHQRALLLDCETAEKAEAERLEKRAALRSAGDAEVYKAAGLAPRAAAGPAFSELCAAWSARLKNMPASSKLVAELNDAERKYRQERAGE